MVDGNILGWVVANRQLGEGISQLDYSTGFHVGYLIFTAKLEKFYSNQFLF